MPAKEKKKEMREKRDSAEEKKRTMAVRLL